jgi:hypothetical protein
MASTLQRMQRDGLVRRLPDPADRRRTRVVLSQPASLPVGGSRPARPILPPRRTFTA